MKKVINPVKCKFVSIDYNAGRLSLSGVVGPMSNGNSKGGAGQCVDDIRTGEPTAEWTVEDVAKLCDIWDEYHLNDCHNECGHQRKLGWCEMAKEPLTLYHFKLNDETIKKQRAATEAANKALKEGKTFTPTKEQTKFANLPYFLDTFEKLDGDEYYTPYKGSIHPAEETQSRGWTYFTGNSKGWGPESPLGLLCRPCPVCGYRYGTGHCTLEVPKEIIEWLFALPETKITPAWCL